MKRLAEFLQQTPLYPRGHAVLSGCPLVVETAFGNADEALARLSQHLSPHALARELDQIARGHDFPIYITHTKPSQTGQIMGEVFQHDHAQAGRRRPHDIRGLQAGQEWQM